MKTKSPTVRSMLAAAAVAAASLLGVVGLGACASQDADAGDTAAGRRATATAADQTSRGKPTPAVTPMAGASASATANVPADQAPAERNAAVVGTWDLALTFQGEPQKITLKIEERADGTLTGTWIGPHRTNELVDFAWDGTTLTFTRNVDRQGSPAALRHKATVTGDQMKGTITAPEGELAFTAKRTAAP